MIPGSDCSNIPEPPSAWIARTTDDMLALGAMAAADAVPGSVFALTGDLGAGKTHWTKGLVRALGSPVDVTSPTFPLVHEYHGGACPVYHFDFYRLSHPEEILAIGWDEYLEENGVLVVEWADKFPHLLPPQTRWLHITLLPDGSRALTRR